MNLDIKSLESPRAKAVRTVLESKVVGQREAIDGLIDLLEKYHAQLHDHSRPIGSALFLGPTGTGKGRVIESFCEAIGGNPNHCVRIDCGEFQQDHEMAKLIGSPPGYLGHRETPARFTQKTLDGLQTNDHKFSIIFLDEIEKASDSLWHLFLSILDKGRITLGDNSTTDFRNTLILMASNAGSQEMDRLILGTGIGFNNPQVINEKEIAEIGKTAAKKKFTPEFINRIDRIVAFHTLTKDQITKICDLELEIIQQNILSQSKKILFLEVTQEAKSALILEGYDPKYNGRNIRRVIEQRVGMPIARVLAAEITGQGDTVMIDYKNGEYVFEHLEKRITSENQ